MSNLKFTNPHYWSILETHLTSGRGERFAFAHTRPLEIGATPVLEVIGIELIDDADVYTDRAGWQIADAALDRVHNAAITGGYGLVEFHNHHLGPPGFSRTDEAGLTPMAEYVTSLMPGRPYGAGVYAEGHVHVEHWTRHSGGILRERFRSVTVIGHQFRLLNAAPPDAIERLSRQHDVLGLYGVGTLAGLRVALIGAGGTGSHVALALAYLGVAELLVFDDDHVEVSNLNRLVTAGQADIGAPKGLVARRRTREIDPVLGVVALGGITPDGDHPELDDVDLIIGCVDHDGPRDRLNQIAVDTATPYIDIATGIDTDTDPPIAGGRVILVVPGGPCLHCLGELDAGEISRWAKSPEQQALDRQHGYGSRGPNPAVVHLNGLAVHAAVAEIVAWIAGHRQPAHQLDIDLNGTLARADATPGTRITPRQPITALADCISCGSARKRLAAPPMATVALPD
jgi:hypothetical protein